jgi:parafibromin
MSKNIFVASDTEVNPESISLIDSIKTASAVTPKASLAAKKSFVPIIIVPAAPTAIITMYNIQDFLFSSRFVTTVDAKNQSVSPKQSLLTLDRIAVDGRKQSYQIIDNPARLSLEDWARVSAVFVHGPAWQFKGWKWDNPVELFENSTLLHSFNLAYAS